MSVQRPIAQLIAGVLTTFMLALPGGAWADSQVTRDPAGDVIAIDTGNPGSATSAPWHWNGDLRRYAIHHGDRRVWGVMKFRALKRSDPHLFLMAAFRWQDSIQFQYGEVVIEARRGRWVGVSRFSTVRTCSVEHHIDYARDRVSFSFSTRCLATPPWIQSYATATTDDGGRRPKHYFHDVAPDEANEGRWGNRIPRG